MLPLLCNNYKGPGPYTVDSGQKQNMWYSAWCNQVDFAEKSKSKVWNLNATIHALRTLLSTFLIPLFLLCFAFIFVITTCLSLSLFSLVIYPKEFSNPFLEVSSLTLVVPPSSARPAAPPIDKQFPEIYGRVRVHRCAQFVALVIRKCLSRSP